MSIFKTKKNEDCCNTTKTEINCNTTKNSLHSIKVLGSGCKSCHALLENTKTAVSDLKLNVKVEYLTEFDKIMKYGAMSMPALVINEKVVSVGKVLKPEEIKNLFNN